MANNIEEEKDMQTKMNVLMLLMGASLICAVPAVYADTASVGAAATQPAAPSTPSAAPQAEEHAEHHGKHGWGHKHHGMMDKMNLTEDQENQMKAIGEKQKEAMKADFKQMKEDGKAFRDALLEPTVDMTKINAIQAKMKASRDQMMDGHLNMMLDVKKILTPEQFKMYIKMEEHKMREHGEWMKKKEKECMHCKEHMKGHKRHHKDSDDDEDGDI